MERCLAKHGSPAVVIGQVAGILHGSTELTGDLDFLWPGKADDAGPMAAACIDLAAEWWKGPRAGLPDADCLSAGQ